MGLLDGKVAIVTGSGRGVGRGEAILLAHHGAKVVVNDLGGSQTGEGAVKTTEDDFDSVIRVHLKGTFCVSHHAANYWRDQSKSGSQPRASIINTVSSAGLQGNVGQTSYGAAKAGIAAMTIIHSLELARLG